MLSFAFEVSSAFEKTAKTWFVDFVLLMYSERRTMIGTSGIGALLRTIAARMHLGVAAYPGGHSDEKA